MTLWEHLAELRKRLVYCLITLVICTGVAWVFREYLFAVFTKPYVDAWNQGHIEGGPTIHFQTPAAAFLAYFKLSILGGVALGMPVLFWQIWAFVAPGLYGREKRFVIPLMGASTLLFLGGGYFGWKLVFPLAFKYLLGFSGTLAKNPWLKDVDLTIKPTLMMGEYIDFVTRMLLGFGLVFEIPLVIFFLSVAGIINYLHLIRYGRWFVLCAFAAAAFITPPDITSQIMMAVPMLVLYVGSILLAYIFGKPPSEGQISAYKNKKERIKREREEEKKRRREEKKALKAEKERLKKAKKRKKKKKGKN